MKQVLWLLSGLLLLFPGTLPAAELPVDQTLTLDLPQAGSRWTLTREAPAFLVAETAEHLAHELLAQGKRLDDAALRTAAQKRLAANEGYLCNPASQACLVIDFSPLRAGEEAPSAKTVAASARYAAEGLSDEEGMTDVRQRTAKAAIPGADTAWQIDADFRHHGEARRFIGVVGFRAPYWFYLYYTDPQRDPSDFAEMEKVLRTVALRGMAVMH